MIIRGLTFHSVLQFVETKIHSGAYAECLSCHTKNSTVDRRDSDAETCDMDQDRKRAEAWTSMTNAWGHDEQYFSLNLAG